MINRSAILKFAASVLSVAAGTWGFASANFDETKILHSDATEGCHFGASTAVGPSTIVVGNLGCGVPSGPGAVYVFQDVSLDGDWSNISETKINASDGFDHDVFGYSVAMDDGTIVVGGFGAEAAYIYQDVSASGDWSSVRETKIVNPHPAPGDQFALSVDVNGSVVAVGQPGRHRTYLFRDTSASGDWSTYEQVLFYVGGNSVDIDDGILLTGADSSASIFVDTSLDSSWSSYEQIQLVPAIYNQEFGTSVSLSGSVAAIGETDDTVYLFLDTSEDKDWSAYDQVAIEPFDADPLAPPTAFGYSISLSDSLLVVGAYTDGEVGGAAGSY